MTQHPRASTCLRRVFLLDVQSVLRTTQNSTHKTHSLFSKKTLKLACSPWQAKKVNEDFIEYQNEDYRLVLHPLLDTPVAWL